VAAALRGIPQANEEPRMPVSDLLGGRADSVHVRRMVAHAALSSPA
jgi:hypothetical protein